MLLNKIFSNSFCWVIALLLGAVAQPASAERNSSNYEPFMNVSVFGYSANVDDKDVTAVIDDTEGASYSLTAGIRNQIGRHRIGTAIEYTDIFTSHMIGFRAVDYVFQPSDRLMFGGFFGAAALDSGLSQNGYYMGVNASLAELLAGFDLTVELRYASGLARDRQLDTDIPGGDKPDLFLDINALAIGFTKRF